MPYPIKSHCPQGHEYTPENTGRDNRGTRFCRECTRIRARAYKKAHPEVVAKHAKLYAPAAIERAKPKNRAKSRARGLYASTQFADGVAAERAAIVAWLRRDIGPWLRDEREEYAVEFAAAIEAGEHNK